MENRTLILKRNIKNLMNNHNPKVTQAQIGKITGASQPQMSKYLSETDISFFRVDQLIKIADFFHVSLDELAGRNLSGTPKATGTMVDVITALFELEVADFDINERHTHEIEPNPVDGSLMNVPVVSHDISFNNIYLDNFLSDWKAVRQTINTMKNQPQIKQMYEAWKKDQIDKASHESLNGYFSRANFMDISVSDDDLPFN